MDRALAGYPLDMIVIVVVVPLLSILAMLGMERLEARLLPDSPVRRRVLLTPVPSPRARPAASFRYSPTS